MDEVTGPCLMFVRPHTMVIPRPESVEKMNGREAKVKLRNLGVANGWLRFTITAASGENKSSLASSSSCR
jgi:hypothetical protein